jgi:thiol-disulfide isomerase/thioredoxin
VPAWRSIPRLEPLSLPIETDGGEYNIRVSLFSLTLRSHLIGAVIAVVAVAADIPRASPPFTIQRVGATPIQLSQYRGKIVSLTFMSTTCSHCEEFTKILNVLAKEYTPRGVQFLECAFNSGALAALPSFVQRLKPGYPVGYSSNGAVLQYLSGTTTDLRPIYIPRVVFLDRTGVIRVDITGEDNFFQNAEAGMRAQLEKILKGSQAKP